MPTERFACLAAGAAILLALLGMHGQWQAHFIGFGLATALLWRGTAGCGRTVLVALLVVGGLEWLHRSVAPGRGADLLDFIAGAVAALAVAGALFIRGRYLCAESSEP